MGCTYVDHVGVVSQLEIVEHRGLVEISQIRHVFDFVELGRVALFCLLDLDFTFLNILKERQRETDGLPVTTAFWCSPRQSRELRGRIRLWYL